MAGILFSKLSGTNDPLYGRYEHEIRAIIEDAADTMEKDGQMLRTLFNVETSHSSSEAIVGQDSFGTFRAASEGSGAENDEMQKIFAKYIEHIAFMKEFTVTREMVDDAKYGMTAAMTRIPRAFVRSYYNTKADIAGWALAKAAELAGTQTHHATFNGASVDLSVGDTEARESLFGNHAYLSKKRGDPDQTNFFCADVTGRAVSAGGMEQILSLLTNKMRNVTDENGRPLGYTADTIILPGNRPTLERMVRTVVGSERTTGSANNDINLQYGGWRVVVLPYWQADDDRFIFMSSRANEDLMGNMFFDRCPLDVRSEIDTHTRNFVWNGYCRFGVGFGNWKHIGLYVDTAGVSGAASLA